MEENESVAGCGLDQNPNDRIDGLVAVREVLHRPFADKKIAPGTLEKNVSSPRFATIARARARRY